MGVLGDAAEWRVVVLMDAATMEARGVEGLCNDEVNEATDGSTAKPETCSVLSVSSAGAQH